jgi:hypothetical protein
MVVFRAMDRTIGAPVVISLSADSKKVLYLAIEDLQKGGRAIWGQVEPANRS